VIYYSLIGTLISAFPAGLYWQTPDSDVLLVMLFAGIAATLGQILLTYSYSLAPASRIGPFTYSTVIFAALYGWVFWEEIPDTWMSIGAILICFAGIMAMQRKKARPQGLT